MNISFTTNLFKKRQTTHFYERMIPSFLKQQYRSRKIRSKEECFVHDWFVQRTTNDSFSRINDWFAFRMTITELSLKISVANDSLERWIFHSWPICSENDYSFHDRFVRRATNNSVSQMNDSIVLETTISFANDSFERGIFCSRPIRSKNDR